MTSSLDTLTFIAVVANCYSHASDTFMEDKPFMLVNVTYYFNMVEQCCFVSI